MNPKGDPPSAGALFAQTGQQPQKQSSNPYLHPVGLPQGSAQPNPYLIPTQQQPQQPSFSPAPVPQQASFSPHVQRHSHPAAAAAAVAGAAPQPYQPAPYQSYQPQQPAYYYQQPQQSAATAATGMPYRGGGSQGQMYQPAAYQQPQGYQPQQAAMSQQQQAYYYQQQQMPQQHQQQHSQHQHAASHWNIQYSDLQLGQELGRGAFGIVYKGRWRLTDVAIKVSQGKLTGEDLATFQKETLLMMNLRPHKNVVQLRGVCQNPLCVVIDFVEGGSLERRLHDRSKELGWAKIFQLAQGIVAGMLHIHLEGIVHRDLASRNVLLDALDNPLIADFGLSAQTFGQLQEKGFFRGPYKWMAPESLAANQFSVASDVWSFGVTLWEILARRLPFEDKDIYQVRDEVVRVKLRLPLATKWPEVWRNLLIACWRTDPALRPDMATIGGWLQQMRLDFDRDSAADGYAFDPALSAEDLRPAAPAVGAAPAPVTVAPTVAPTPVVATTATATATTVAPPTLTTTPPPAATDAATHSAPLPTAAKSENESKSQSSSALPVVGSPGVSRHSAPHVIPTKSESAGALHLSAPPSASTSANVLPGNPQPPSPTIGGRKQAGKIFNSLERLTDQHIDIVDARPDVPHTPVAEKK